MYKSFASKKTSSTTLFQLKFYKRGAIREYEEWDITSEEIQKIILDFIHKETGYANPLEPYCGFEELDIVSQESTQDGKILVVFNYHFDEDGFSQYDKSHHLSGGITIDENGEIFDWSLTETHTGVAANLDTYKTKSKSL